MSTIDRLKSRAADIQRLQAELTAELDEIRVAIRVIERLGDDARQVVRSSVPSAPSGVPVTVRDGIIHVLHSSFTLWLSANKIQEEVSILLDRMVPMGSISPLLTQLKNEKILVRRGYEVALAERAKREGDPEGSPNPEVEGTDTPDDFFNVNPRPTGAD